MQVKGRILLGVHGLVGVPYTLGKDVGARVGEDLRGGSRASESVEPFLRALRLPMGDVECS